MVVVSLRVLASVTNLASTVVVVDGPAPRVLSVARGSVEWLAGVREGDPYVPWPMGDGGEVATPSGDVGVPNQWPPRPVGGAFAAVLFLVVALGLWTLVPFLGAVLLFASAAFSTSGLMGTATMPVALFITALPAIAALPLAWTPGRAGRTTLSVTLVAMALVGGTVVVAIEGPTGWELAWTLSWVMPAIVVLLVVSGGVVVGALRGSRTHRAGQSLAGSLVGETMLGRRALRSSVEDGRDRTAQLLHDRVLPGVAAGLGALESGDPIGGARLLRSLAGELRQDLDQEQLVVIRLGGLGAALEGPVERVEQLGIPCLLCVVDRGRPPWEVEVTALRIAQEALNNAVAHSSASAIRVDCEFGPQQVHLHITDDGVGLDSQPGRRGTRQHLGLAAMSNRATEVGGRVLIDSTRRSGLRVSFEWPA